MPSVAPLSAPAVSVHGATPALTSPQRQVRGAGRCGRFCPWPVTQAVQVSQGAGLRPADGKHRGPGPVAQGNSIQFRGICTEAPGQSPSGLGRRE